MSTIIRDRREEILARLSDLLSTIPDVKVFRNRLDVPATLRPAIVIFDNDEEGAVGDFGLGRPPSRPTIMQLKPMICLMAGAWRDTIGNDLSALRFAVIPLLLRDEGLLEITTSSGGIQYQGCTTDLAKGQTVEGQLVLHFDLHYPLFPSEMLGT